MSLYGEYCESCHGEGADGRSELELDPPAPALNTATALDSMSDGYLFWRIASGSVATPPTAMPAFEDLLTEDEHWAIISYLRSLP